MIGLPLTITKIHQYRTHPVHQLAGPMCCAAVRGISTMPSFVPRIAAHILRSPTWVSDSDVLRMRIRKENVSSSKEQYTCKEYYFPFISCCYFQPVQHLPHPFQRLFP